MQTVTYITSFLTFYLKGEVSVDKNFVDLKTPNTILGLIPLGKHNNKVPVNQISSVTSDFRLLFKNLLAGLVVTILGFGSIGDNFVGGLIIAIIGIIMILNSFQTVVIITMTSGSYIPVYFIIFEKSKAAIVENNINQYISGRMADTNVKDQTARIVDAINKK